MIEYKMELESLQEGEAVFVRCFLTSYILHTNAQRRGPVVNMTLSEIGANTIYLWWEKGKSG